MNKIVPMLDFEDKKRATRIRRFLVKIGVRQEILQMHSNGMVVFVGAFIFDDVVEAFKEWIKKDAYNKQHIRAGIIVLKELMLKYKNEFEELYYEAREQY